MIYEEFLSQLEREQVATGDIDTKQAERMTRLRRQDMANLLNTKEGMRVIWRQLAEGGIFSTTYTGDNDSCIFNEGRRALALALLSKVQSANPKAFITMQTAQLAEDTRYV